MAPDHAETLAPRNVQAPINHWSLPGINPARQCRIADKNWLRSVNSDAVGLIEVAVSFGERLIGANKTRMSCWSGGGSASAVADDASSDSLCSKASSTSLASVAARRFLAASASCAQIAALSADVPKRSQQLLPQRGRVLGLEGARPLAVHPVATLSIAGLCGSIRGCPTLDGPRSPTPKADECSLKPQNGPPHGAAYRAIRTN
jgi:hypothetical protein